MPDFIVLENAPNVNILLCLKPGIYGELESLARSLGLSSAASLVRHLIAYRLDIDIKHLEGDKKCSSKS